MTISLLRSGTSSAGEGRRGIEVVEVFLKIIPEANSNTHIKAAVYGLNI